MSQKAPLQDRFSERIRARGPGIQFGDRRVVLAEECVALVSRISDRDEDAQVISSQILRQSDRRRKRFTTTGVAAIAALLLASRRLVTGAMLMFRGWRRRRRQ